MPIQTLTSQTVTDSRRTSSTRARYSTVALAVAACVFYCQSSPAQAQAVALTAEEAVRLAVERDPSVTAAMNRVEVAAAGVRSARAPFNPQGEIAPGAGFTNGNAILSQQIDIGGRRSAQ